MGPWRLVAASASQSESWAATSASAAVLTVQAEGGGDLQFTDLAMVDVASTPLSGHLAWDCDLA